MVVGFVVVVLGVVVVVDGVVVVVLGVVVVVLGVVVVVTGAFCTVTDTDGSGRRLVVPDEFAARAEIVCDPSPTDVESHWIEYGAE